MLTSWIVANEALWLFWLIFSELLVGLATLTILVIEYNYDREWNESKSRKKKATKNRVKVVIDAEGNARISEAPKDVDVSIEHQGAQHG